MRLNPQNLSGVPTELGRHKFPFAVALQMQPCASSLVMGVFHPQLAKLL